jgi:DNA-binding NarL/FixJ family response regulator
MDIRCLLIDDNVAFLHAMRSMLERDGATVVGMVSNGDDAAEQVRMCRPDVVMIDVRLGQESGFDVGHRIEEQAAVGGSRPAIVLVSTHAEDELADRIAANPSFAFLDKTTVSVDKIRALIDTRRDRVVNRSSWR